MADKLVFLLSTGSGEDYGVHGVVLDREEASEIARRWNAQSPEGDPKFYVDPVPLVTSRTAGNSPFGVAGEG